MLETFYLLKFGEYVDFILNKLKAPEYIFTFQGSGTNV